MAAIRAANAPVIVQARQAHKAAASSGRKRKAETSLEEDIAAYKQSLDHIKTNGMMLDKEYRQVRNIINKLLDNGIIKKGEFRDATGNSYGALNSFLKKIGTTDGYTSDVCQDSWDWFKQREVAGLKMPDVKKRQKIEAAATQNTAAAAPHHLPGEEIGDVKVYDTCDEIRRKLNEHLKTPSRTQAQFCRDLYAQLRMAKTTASGRSFLLTSAPRGTALVTPPPPSMPHIRAIKELGSDYLMVFGGMNTVPWPGKSYIIRHKDSDRAITLVDGKVHLAHLTSECNCAARWICNERDGWLGFRNPVSGTYLGIGTSSSKGTIEAVDQGGFCARKNPDGGYILLVKQRDSLLKVDVNPAATLVASERRGAVWVFSKV
ncbi:hypothetical protein DL770_011828 [Monosporascus sp. CRB-9-2]|nr:hypothetical protein DL770_011828 [Monosporascus sp. CRB-9-2]